MAKSVALEAIVIVLSCLVEVVFVEVDMIRLFVVAVEYRLEWMASRSLIDCCLGVALCGCLIVVDADDDEKDKNSRDGAPSYRRPVDHFRCL